MSNHITKVLVDVVHRFTVGDRVRSIGLTDENRIETIVDVVQTSHGIKSLNYVMRDEPGNSYRRDTIAVDKSYLLVKDHSLMDDRPIKVVPREIVQ